MTAENQWHQRWPRRLNLYSKLARQLVAKRRRTHLRNRQSARGNHHHWRAKFFRLCSGHKFRRFHNVAYLRIQKNLDSSVTALGFEQPGNFLSGAVAKKLAQRFFVVGNSIFFDPCNEIGGCTSGYGGL